MRIIYGIFIFFVSCVASFAQIDDPDIASPTWEKGWYHYIDKTGKIVIPSKYGAAGDFSEGLAPVKIGGNWKKSIPFGVRMTYYDGEWGYIDRKGHFRIKPQFLDVSLTDLVIAGATSFNEGWARVGVKTENAFHEVTWAYIDKKGMIQLKVDDKISISFLGKFSQGLAPVDSIIQGFINKKDEIAFPGEFDRVRPFCEGMAAVRCVSKSKRYEAMKWGFVNQNGKRVIDFQFRNVGDFSEGLAPAAIEEGKYGFIDKKGKFVLQPQYFYAESFSEGLAPVTKRFHSRTKDECSKTGYIDKEGHVVIDYQFEDAKAFSVGLAPVKKHGKWGYIDKSGENHNSGSI